MTNNQKIETNIKGFGYGLILILIMQLIIAIISGVHISINKYLHQTKSVIVLVSFTISMALTLYVAMKMWGTKKIDTNRVYIPIYFLIIPAVFAVMVISEGLASSIPMPEKFQKLLEGMVSFDLAGFITIGLLAPIFEECIFRGVILKNFLNKYDVKKAIILSALLFGIAHLNPWQFIGAFFMGLLLGWVYYKTKSIIPAIFMHSLNNSFAFYMGKKYDDINVTIAEQIGTTHYILLVLASVLTLFICYYAFLKIMESKLK